MGYRVGYTQSGIRTVWSTYRVGYTQSEIHGVGYTEWDRVGHTKWGIEEVAYTEWDTRSGILTGCFIGAVVKHLRGDESIAWMGNLIDE